jgi:TolB-like protein
LIVVLPFANMASDSEHEYFVDGLTESLTTDLSRIRGSFVIGRSTAFTYKGRDRQSRPIADVQATAWGCLPLALAAIPEEKPEEPAA